MSAVGLTTLIDVRKSPHSSGWIEDQPLLDPTGFSPTKTEQFTGITYGDHGRMLACGPEGLSYVRPLPDLESQPKRSSCEPLHVRFLRFSKDEQD